MTGRLGIIAGAGALPVVLARHVGAQGDVFVVRLSGFADAALGSFAGIELNIGEIGGVMEALRSAGCGRIVFAGAVKRPDFSTLRLDEAGQHHLPALVAAAARGDDALLSALVGIFGDEGFEVVGAETLCPELLCPVGLIAGAAPDERVLRDLSKALRIARLIGREDIGQGCVVADGLVLAVEAQEGTDGMLRRLADLPLAVRGTPEARRGVLVKCAKPDQERRIDLPVVGTQTIEMAARAGLVGIGLEAGSCLIVEREAVVDMARAQGIFVMGLEHGDGAG